MFDPWRLTPKNISKFLKAPFVPFIAQYIGEMKITQEVSSVHYYH